MWSRWWVEIKIKENVSYRQRVGLLNLAKINTLLGTSFTISKVYIYPGTIKHVKKRHPGVWEKHGQSLPDIISTPDFIGVNPREPNSMELYKYINDTMLLAIKLDPTGYMFVSSLYDLHNAPTKIHKRLASGRIVRYSN